MFNPRTQRQRKADPCDLEANFVYELTFKTTRTVIEKPCHNIYIHYIYNKKHTMTRVHETSKLVKKSQYTMISRFSNL